MVTTDVLYITIIVCMVGGWLTYYLNHKDWWARRGGTPFIPVEKEFQVLLSSVPGWSLESKLRLLQAVSDKTILAVVNLNKNDSFIVSSTISESTLDDIEEKDKSIG